MRQKSKYVRQKKNKNGYFIVLIGFLILCLFVLRNLNKEPQIKQKDYLSKTESKSIPIWATNMESVSGGIYLKALPEKWFSAEESDKFQNLTSDLNLALSQNSKIKEVKDLKKMFFGKFFMSFFVEGVSRRIFADEKSAQRFLNELARSNEPAGSLEIVFYEQKYEYHSKIQQRLAFYDSDWRSLFLAAVEYADKKWFDAVVLHELIHAQYQRLNKPSAKAEMLSDDWVSEEIAAHRVENKILDLQTKGQYSRFLKETVLGIQADEPIKLWENIRLAHIMKLDSLFNQGTRSEYYFRISQYWLDLTREFLKTRYSGDDLLKKEIYYYRLFVRQFTF